MSLMTRAERNKSQCWWQLLPSLDAMARLDAPLQTLKLSDEQQAAQVMEEAEQAIHEAFFAELPAAEIPHFEMPDVE